MKIVRNKIKTAKIISVVVVFLAIMISFQNCGRISVSEINESAKAKTLAGTDVFAPPATSDDNVGVGHGGGSGTDDNVGVGHNDDSEDVVVVDNNGVEIPVVRVCTDKLLRNQNLYNSQVIQQYKNLEKVKSFSFTFLLFSINAFLSKLLASPFSPSFKAISPKNI